LNKKNIILAIETSCDETSVAIVKNGQEVLACETATSIPLHQITKGVVPEVAARAQIEAMIPTLDLALKKAQLSWSNIDLIAVTEGPGLIGSLLVGVATANMLSLSTGIPAVGVPHIWGHMYANLLDNKESINFPTLVLTVSGGHNDLYLWKKHGDFEQLGRTLDDAAGEAFDKCGRLIGLNYPAGVEVSKLADAGNKEAYKFPRSMINSQNYNFSFSGLKTAFLYKLKNIEKSETKINKKIKADLCASLQEAICETLWLKVKKALNNYVVNEVHLSGGVSANTRLREIFKKNLKKIKPNAKLRHPNNLTYCTDNAAMIGACAYFCNFEAVTPNKNTTGIKPKLQY